MSNIWNDSENDTEKEANTDAVSVLQDMLAYAMAHPTKSVAIALIPEEGMPVCSYSDGANSCTQVGALHVMASELALGVTREEQDIEETRMDS